MNRAGATTPGSAADTLAVAETGRGVVAHRRILITYKAAARARPRHILASALVALALGWAVPAWAQETPSTTAPGSTPELLVPGDTAPVTTAPGDSVPTVSVPNGSDDGDGGGLDASTKVWLIVVGLVLVAIVTAALTVLFWRHTKPDPLVEEKPEREPRRWARLRAEEPPLDPTQPQPRPQLEPTEASSPDEPAEAEPAIVPAEPESEPKPTRPEPDYWSGV